MSITKLQQLFKPAKVSLAKVSILGQWSGISFFKGMNNNIQEIKNDSSGDSIIIIHRFIGATVLFVEISVPQLIPCG